MACALASALRAACALSPGRLQPQALEHDCQNGECVWLCDSRPRVLTHIVLGEEPIITPAARKALIKEGGGQW